MAKKINPNETYLDYSEAFYRLTADIDLGGKKEWVPIGHRTVRADRFDFAGTFDGGRHTVRGVRINSKYPLLGQKQTDFGLFCRLEGTVKDLTISNSSIKAGDIICWASIGTPELHSCRNSGSLCTDDLCGSWPSRLS